MVIFLDCISCKENAEVGITIQITMNGYHYLGNVICSLLLYLNHRRYILSMLKQKVSEAVFLSHSYMRGMLLSCHGLSNYFFLVLHGWPAYLLAQFFYLVC